MKSFHFFGNVWLEDPRKFLKDEHYRRLLTRAYAQDKGFGIELAEQYVSTNLLPLLDTNMAS